MFLWYHNSAGDQQHAQLILSWVFPLGFFWGFFCVFVWFGYFCFLVFFTSKRCFIIFKDRLFYWFQAAMKSQKCSTWMCAQEWDKSRTQEKATTLQWVSPSHLIKFCTVLQSHISGLDLNLKQWNRIWYSVPFCQFIREAQKGLGMARQEGCELLAWANWLRKKWGSGRTVYQSVNISWKQQGCIMLPNSLKQSRQGRRKHHCLAAAFPSQRDCATRQDRDPFHPTAGEEPNTSESKCMSSSQTLMRLNSKAIPQKLVLVSSLSKMWEGGWIFAYWFVRACWGGEKIFLCY